MPGKKHMPEFELREPTAVLAVEAPEMKLYTSIADNESAAAFRKQLSKLELELKDDGSFSKTGVLPYSLPFDAKELDAEPGDVLLTGENTLAICYDNKTLKAVRIGGKTYKSKEQILEIFGEGDVNVSFYLEWSE